MIGHFSKYRHFCNSVLVSAITVMLLAGCGSNHETGDHWRVSSPATPDKGENLFLMTDGHSDTLFFSPARIKNGVDSNDCQDMIILSDAPSLILHVSGSGVDQEKKQLEEKVLNAYICLMQTQAIKTEMIAFPSSIYYGCSTDSLLTTTLFQTNGKTVTEIRP